MIGIDTNILVRFLTQDDEIQYQQALHLFHTQDIFICDTVWLESEWVLRYTYGFKATEIGNAFLKTLGLPNVQVSDTQIIAQAIQLRVLGFDFADALHWLNNQHCKTLMTFDHKFAKKAKTIDESLVSVTELGKST